MRYMFTSEFAMQTGPCARCDCAQHTTTQYSVSVQCGIRIDTEYTHHDSPDC